MLTRRQFFTRVLPPLALMPGLALGISSQVERTDIPLYVEGLGPEFENYRIAFITDIHHGRWLSPATLQAVCDHLAKAAPDLLLLGGDYIGLPEGAAVAGYQSYENRRFSNLDQFSAPPQIFDDLGAQLSVYRPKDGVFAVLGNHDRWLAPYTAMQVLPQHGVNLLVNQSAKIRRGSSTLHLFGLDDLWTGVPRLAVPKRKAPGETRVLLSHNPDTLSAPLDDPGFEFDLGLAGHTHAGQVKIPFMGALFYNVVDNRLGEGLYENREKRCYTSRGIGTVELPLRVNCPPEVVVIELLRA